MPTDPNPEPEPVPVPVATARVSRRSFARRTAVVVAGGAGVLAAPALTPNAAAEGAGDPLLLGGRNRAGDAQTRLQSRPTVATLSVYNERVRRGRQYGEVDIVAPQLRLESPVPGGSRPQVPDVERMAAGDLAAAGGLLFFGAETDGYDVVPSQVFTSYFANFLSPVEPGRSLLLDTRVLTAQERSAYGPGAFDASGRLTDGARIAVDARSLVNTTAVVPRAAVALSITVIDAVSSGAVTVYADATAGTGVEIAVYSVLPAAVTANGQPYPIVTSAAAIVGLDAQDRLWLSVTHSAHLVLKVTGIFVADPTVVVESAAPHAATTPGMVARLDKQRSALRRLTAGIRPAK